MRRTSWLFTSMTEELKAELPRAILGNLSNDDGDAKDDAWKKMNLYFTVEFRRCLDLFITSIGLRTCSSLICNASVQFQMRIRKISRRRSRSPKYPELGHFTLSFCRGPLRNVPRIITHVHSYCSAH